MTDSVGEHVMREYGRGAERQAGGTRRAGESDPPPERRDGP